MNNGNLWQLIRGELFGKLKDENEEEDEEDEDEENKRKEKVRIYNWTELKRREDEMRWESWSEEMRLSGGHCIVFITVLFVLLYSNFHFI